jgi:class 3 adenylate cyclase/pimeloyl-ACP methyl ester carboxylesterase
MSSTPNESERRLAAVFVADMVGFSRLMEIDEQGTLERLRGHRVDLIDPLIKQHHGRIVKTTGDGVLTEFVSVVDAVECAIAIQESMVVREAATIADSRIQYRIGVNLGDVVVDEGDIFGDGVNIAARLEGICQPGGVCVADVVYQSVEHQLHTRFRDLGPQSVKNISRAIHAWQWEPTLSPDVLPDAPQAWDPDTQEIKFATSSDGVTIAYASVGSGPPLVKAPNWMNHLQYDWKSPVWRHLMQELSRSRTLVRFDQRGTGLSDREVDEISHEAFVRDLETVVDAVGLERFPLLGISQGCSISVRYAYQNPDRVSGLILYGGYAQGQSTRTTTDSEDLAEAKLAIIRHGWGRDDPSFRQFFTNVFMPEATPDQMKWFNDLQRMSTEGEMAMRIARANGQVDITDILPKVDVPALVLHVREDGQVPFEQGRLMASLLPNARFVPLEGRNHLMLEDEPAWTRFVAEVQGFLRELDD